MNTVSWLRDRDFSQGGKPNLFSKSNTLLLVKKDSSSYFATNVTGKYDLLSNFSEGDKMYFVWGGQWSSDIYQIDDKDVTNFNGAK